MPHRFRCKAKLPSRWVLVTATYFVRYWSYTLAYHTTRAPKYAARLLARAPRGAGEFIPVPAGAPSTDTSPSPSSSTGTSGSGGQR